VSRENVEIVRRGMEAWNAGDMDRIRDFYDPDAVMYHLEGWPEPGPSVGREAVMRQWEQVREAWHRGDRLDLGDFIEAGNQVLARGMWRVAGSGPEAAMAFSVLFTLRNGRVITQQYFWDHAEALEAVGLRE
jgi:ketosteroid isomerase-like protein